jgi:hypothetical protein
MLMGRGRQKAKQAKVARELKYHTVDTDFAALQRELRGAPESVRVNGSTDLDADADGFDDDPQSR